MSKETERSTLERVAVVATAGIVAATVFVAPNSIPEPREGERPTVSSPSASSTSSARDNDPHGQPTSTWGDQDGIGMATDRLDGANSEDIVWHGRHAKDCAKAAVAVNLDGVPFAVSGSSVALLPKTGRWNADVTLVVDGTGLEATKMAEVLPQIMAEFCEGIHNGTPDVESTSLKVVAVDSESFGALLDGAGVAPDQTSWVAYASVDMPSDDGDTLGNVKQASVVAEAQTIPVNMRAAGFSSLPMGE